MAMAAVACTSSTTKLTGKFSPEKPVANVEVIVGAQMDTTITVVEDSFTLEAPKDVKALAYAMGGGKQIMFVSDGTNITLDFDEGKAVSKGGVNAKLQEYFQWNKDFMDNLSRKLADLSEDQKDEFLDKAVEEYNAYMLKAVKDNHSNVISLLAATSLELEDDAKMLEVLKSLDPVFQEDPRVKKMIESYDALAKTAEGQMFTDFEVDGVKFSDFIGQGKYVLVDFWASWCGPCRREIPNIRAVYEEFAGENFDVLSIAVWDRPEETVRAAEEENVEWSQIINAQKIPTEIYGIQGIPHIILFGPDGTILKRGLRGDNIREAVKEALDR